MQIVTVTQKSRSTFEALLPLDMAASIGTSGHYCMGAVGEDEKGKYAAGVLVFDIEEGPSEDEIFVGAVLQWLYVAREFRGRGVANALMEEFYHVLKQTGIGGVVCDVPLQKECDGLCYLLENWGMEFQLVDRQELTVSLREIRDLNLVYSLAEGESLLSLSDITERRFAAALKKMEKKYGTGLPVDMPQRKEAYEEDISGVVIVDDEIQSMFLVQKNPSGILDLLLLRSFAEQQLAQKQMLALLANGRKQAERKYEQDTRVRIECRLPATAEILNYLFPQHEPPMVRRGVYNALLAKTGDFYDEDENRVATETEEREAMEAYVRFEKKFGYRPFIPIEDSFAFSFLKEELDKAIATGEPGYFAR